MQESDFIGPLEAQKVTRTLLIPHFEATFNADGTILSTGPRARDTEVVIRNHSAIPVRAVVSVFSENSEIIDSIRTRLAAERLAALPEDETTSLRQAIESGDEARERPVRPEVAPPTGVPQLSGPPYLFGVGSALRGMFSCCSSAVRVFSFAVSSPIGRSRRLRSVHSPRSMFLLSRASEGGDFEGGCLVAVSP
jgi:hypothetical protein